MGIKRNDYPEQRAKPSRPSATISPFRIPVPKPPPYLDKLARGIFKRLAAELTDAGTFIRADAGILGEYAQAESDIIDLQEKIREQGNLIPGRHEGDMIVNPLHRLLREARDRKRKSGDRLGLSPKARRAIRAPEPGPPTSDSGDNQMQMFLDGEDWNRPDDQEDTGS